MRQFLLFAGCASTNLKGIHGFVGDYDSFAEAFVALVDRQIPSEWWHILDTQTGEVVERQHLKVRNGMIGFERSHWVVGQPTKEEPVAAPAPAIAVSLPNGPDLSALEADLRSAVVTGTKNGHTNGAANGKANGAAAEH